MANSADLLNCRAWHAISYEVIVQKANREQSASINFAAYLNLPYT